MRHATSIGRKADPSASKRMPGTAGTVRIVEGAAARLLGLRCGRVTLERQHEGHHGRRPHGCGPAKRAAHPAKATARSAAP